MLFHVQPGAPAECVMKPKILLLQPMSKPLEARLDELYEVERLYAAVDAAKLLDTVGAKVRAVVTSGAFGVPEALWSRLPALELVAVHGVGVDQIDLAAARAAGVRIATTPDVLTEDVADLAIGLWLSLVRRIVEGDRYVREGAWKQKRPLALATRASGRRIGVLGLGQIGQAIAVRAAPFAAEVRYHSRAPLDGAPYVHVASVGELARWCDVLFVSVSGGPSTRRLVDAEVLEALGPEGVIINIARGAVVDEAAMVSAILSGAIAGAGLDVFEDEPNVPDDLLSAGHVVLQPHRGSATVEARSAMADLVLRALSDHFAEA